MANQRSNKWAKRLGVGVAITMSLLTLGAGFQDYEVRADARRFTPPGRMIDVGGHKLHLCATGQGGPTVVLEAGASAYQGVWEWIQPEISKTTRVVSYDRAGLGFSEAAEGKRDAATVARELDTLLTSAGEHAPYVLVGHSYGALFVTEYASLFPQKVAGLAYFGVMRFTDVFSAMAEGLSAENVAMARSLYASPSHLESAARELDAWRESAAQARSAQLGAYPKVFLSASGPDVPEVRNFTALHQELANRYPGSIHRVLPGTTHITMVTHRDQSSQVTAAILEMVERVRRQ